MTIPFGFTSAQLLNYFLFAAVGSIVIFAILALLQPSAPWSDDWKKFIGSFAGTALALSVGFMSLMLQQESQAKQKRDEEMAQAQRKLNDENAQMRAQLLHSVGQKSFEVATFKRYIQLPRDLTILCDAKDSAERERARRSLSVTVVDVEVAQTLIEKTLATNFYDRFSLARLLRETTMSARITQGMVYGMVGFELQFIAFGPQLYSGSLANPEPTNENCKIAKRLKATWYGFFRMAAALQLTTCAAYAAISLSPNEGLDRSGRAFDFINNSFGDEKNYEAGARFDGLMSGIAGSLASGKSDFDQCFSYSNTWPDKS